MKTIALIASTVLPLLLVAYPVWAKRGAPQPVTPVVHEGTRFEAPTARMGVVEAWSESTGALLWDVRVYEVVVDPGLERDVQDVYITTLRIQGRDLVVTDEREREFLVDLVTHAARPR